MLRFGIMSFATVIPADSKTLVEGVLKVRANVATLLTLSLLLLLVILLVLLGIATA